MEQPPRAKPVNALWDVLAGLRFFLAMIIVATHLQLSVPLHPVTRFMADCSGYTAILCFLIVSGFSIAHSLSRQTDGFYRRRLIRIYPLYCLAIVLPLLLGAAYESVSAGDLGVAAQNLFFLQSFTTFQTRFNPVVWTLAIEAACYAAAPWLFRRRTWLLILLTCGSAAALFLGAHAKVLYPAYLLYGEPLLITAWAWLAGFIYHRFHRKFWSIFVLGAFVFGVLRFSGLHFEPLNYFPIAVLVSAFAIGRWLRLPAPVGACLSFAGDVSYPLYLFHFPTLKVLVMYMHVRADLILIVATTVVATAFAIVDLKLKPVWRRLFLKRRPAKYRHDAI